MAIRCDGVNDKVEYVDLYDGAANFSICFWARHPAALANDEPVIAKCNAASWVNTFAISGGGAAGSGTGNDNMCFFFDSSAAWVWAQMPDSTIVANEWHWYGFVYDGAGASDALKVQGYWDGAVQALTFAGTLPATLPDSGTNVITIGLYNEGGLDYGAWDVAHLKIWSASLTAAQMIAEYNRAIPSTTANLKIWSPLDDGTSTRDYSGNGNHGTLLEATQIQGPPVGWGGLMPF